MANDDATSKRSAEEIAYARYTLNLQRAFFDLLWKLNRAYGQPAGNAPVTRSQHTIALLATAQFLEQVGPNGDLARFADQFAELAQALNDLDDGVRASIFDLAPAKKRSDPTPVWLARGARVAIAVECLQRCRHTRKSAAKWAAKKHPGLQRLIREKASHRSDNIMRTIILWSENFSGHRIRNEIAACVYNKLKAEVLSYNSDQMEDIADRLLQEAVVVNGRQCRNPSGRQWRGRAF